MTGPNRGRAGDELPPVTATVTTSRLSRPVAATIGVLAAWAALGVGHLVAGLLSAASSPFLAVGDAVVRLSPAAAHRVRQDHVRHRRQARAARRHVRGDHAGRRGRRACCRGRGPNAGGRGPGGDGRRRLRWRLLRADVRPARPRRARCGDRSSRDRRLPLAAPPRRCGPGSPSCRGRGVAADRAHGQLGRGRRARRAGVGGRRRAGRAATSRPLGPRSPPSSPARPTASGRRPSRRARRSRSSAPRRSSRPTATSTGSTPRCGSRRSRPPTGSCACTGWSTRSSR